MPHADSGTDMIGFVVLLLAIGLVVYLDWRSRQPRKKVPRK